VPDANPVAKLTVPAPLTATPVLFTDSTNPELLTPEMLALSE
jgi:hypothetical protein